jgi:hypothetical protein
MAEAPELEDLHTFRSAPTFAAYRAQSAIRPHLGSEIGSRSVTGMVRAQRAKIRGSARLMTGGDYELRRADQAI